jgi:hypothetical protein
MVIPTARVGPVTAGDLASANGPDPSDTIRRAATENAMRDTHTGSPNGKPGVAVRRAVLGGRALEILDSPPSLWLFDRDRHSFLRLPREMNLDIGVLSLHWEPYARLESDPGGRGVIVTLPGPGERRLHTFPAR